MPRLSMEPVQIRTTSTIYDDVCVVHVDIEKQLVPQVKMSTALDQPLGSM